MENCPNDLTQEPQVQSSLVATTVDGAVEVKENVENVVESASVQEPEAVPVAPVAETEEVQDDLAVFTEEIQEEKEISVPETNEGIVERLKALTEHAEQSEKAELDLLKQVFYKRLKDEKAQALAEFVQAGGKEEEFQAEINPLEEEFKQSMAVIKEQRAKLLQAVEHQKELNLEKKRIIIEKIKSFCTSPEDANKAYDTVRNLQNEWKEIKPIPATAASEVWKNYQLVVEMFYDLLKTNTALRDYDFKKNLEAKNKLCEEAEALANEEDIVKASRVLQELHQEFREIGPVAKELREDLWNRFKTASSVVNKRHAQYFETLKEQENENLAQKTAICEKIEAIETANLGSFTVWENVSKEIMALQAEWKTIGHATKKMNNKIYERYRAACDNFFNKKSEYFKQQRKVFSENLAKKTDLCQQAEALKDSTEWNKTTETLVALQKAWREIGPTTHKASVALWERFNTACNTFFDQKKKILGDQKKEENDNLAQKKSIIEELKAQLLDAEENAVEKVRALMAQWNEVGHVPFKEKDKIYAAYKAVCDELYQKLDLRHNSNKANRTDRPSRQNTSASAQGNSLLRMYEAKKNELTTYETNFSFLTAHSKRGNALIDTMQQKIEVLKEEVATLLQKIKDEQTAKVEEPEEPAKAEEGNE